MTIINPADYWPQFFDPSTVGRTAHFVYPNIGGLPGYASTFFYDPATKCMKLVQYDLNNKWLSNWYLQKQAGGLFEVRDDLPQTNSTLAKLFGSQIIEYYSTPIGWGRPAQMIGSGFPYANSPSFSPLKCRPPQYGSGKQVVVFEQLLPEWTDFNGVVWTDVLQMFYQQSWGNGAPNGARWMMVKGVGPIASQWISGQVTEPWQQAVYTRA